jgi:hypothetical protein
MGDRGSKSDSVCKRATSRRFFSYNNIIYLTVKVYSSHRETGSWKKLSNSRLKLPQ